MNKIKNKFNWLFFKRTKYCDFMYSNLVNHIKDYYNSIPYKRTIISTVYYVKRKEKELFENIVFPKLRENSKKINISINYYWICDTFVNITCVINKGVLNNEN